MRDPHVVALRYRVVPVETVTFDAPPAEWETEAFRIQLADDVATFEMLEHHASEETARKCVDEFLRAWEIDVGVRFGRPEMGFQFEGADVIDREPPPPGSGQVIHAQVALAGAIGLAGTVTAHVTRGKYPEPPKGFVASPDVETMWHRYQGYLEGREPLANMAFACLTLLEGNAGTRKRAARQYAICPEVLDKLGYLTSEVGDDRTARKLKRRKEPRPHTPREIAWVEAAIKASIRRVGQWAFDPEASWPQLTMGDLPKL